MVSVKCNAHEIRLHKLSARGFVLKLQSALHHIKPRYAGKPGMKSEDKIDRLCLGKEGSAIETVFSLQRQVPSVVRTAITIAGGYAGVLLADLRLH